MATNEDVLEKLVENMTGETRMFSTKEIIMIGMIIFAGAGQWYATQARIDALEIYIKSQAMSNKLDFSALHSEAASNGAEINAHIQWEMEQKLQAQQDIIDSLRSGK